MNCRPRLVRANHAVDRFSVPGWAATNYGEVETAILKAFKEQGQTSLVQYIAQEVAVGLRVIGEASASHSQKTLLVPVPSAKANFIKRGYLPAKIIATSANRLAGKPLQVTGALSFKRVVSDQAGLDREERERNLVDSMAAKPLVTGRRVLLFDDVVTTGATLVEASRALVEAGAEVVGFLVFSETLLKTHTKT
jgi:predicted amidophosphoribosyltransferase